MQTDFLSALTIRQPARRADPQRARLQRAETRRQALMRAENHPGAAGLARATFAHGNAICGRSCALAEPSAKAWLHACLREGLLRRETRFQYWTETWYVPTRSIR